MKIKGPIGIPHRKTRRLKGNGTPGRIKGFSCRAEPHDRIFAKCSRAYKLLEYGNWKKRGGKTAWEEVH